MNKVILMVLTAALANLVACTGEKTDSADSATVVDSGSAAE